MTDVKDVAVAPTSVAGALYGKVKPAADPKPTPEKVRETREMRLAKWTKELSEIPTEDLAKLEEVMESFVQERFGKVFVTEARDLTQDEVDLMAEEYDDLVFISTALEARKLAMRAMVFAAINVQNADSVVVPPEFTKGALTSNKGGYVSPKGWAFKREGGNQGDPIILWDDLKGFLSADKWDKIVERTPVPASVMEIPDPEKLLDLVEAGEIDIEDLRPFIKAGEFGSVKFVPRPIT